MKRKAGHHVRPRTPRHISCAGSYSANGNSVSREQRSVDGHTVEHVGHTDRIARQTKDQPAFSLEPHARPERITMLSARAAKAHERCASVCPGADPYGTSGDAEIRCGSHEHCSIVLTATTNLIMAAGRLVAVSRAQ